MVKFNKIIFSISAGFILSLAILPVGASADNLNNPSANSAAGSGYSFNWAGYTATNGSYTSASGSWVMPQVETTTTLSANATWVGIGGIKSSDLIQVGTQTIENYNNGQNTYQAWYELLPSGMQTIPVTVNPGDSISVSINETSTNQWNISFKDNTNNQNYSTTVNYASSLSSAEWIEEMPLDSTTNAFIPLDNFSSMQFTGAYATQNGSSLNLEQLNASTLTMLNSSNQALALPSNLGNDGASFSVTRTSATISAENVSGNGSLRITFRRGGTGLRVYIPQTGNQNQIQQNQQVLRNLISQLHGQLLNAQIKFGRNFLSR